MVTVALTLAELAHAIQGGRLTSKNVSVGYVGKNTVFTILEDDDIKPYVDRLPDNEGPEVPPVDHDEEVSQVAW